MRILIKHETSKEGITLPINYHHILQSILYSHMKESGYESLHDRAYEYEKRTYRMFTFSEISGKYKITGKKITFFGTISFMVSSPDTELLRCLKSSIEKSGLRYGDAVVHNVEVTFCDDQIEKNEINIRMLSPICVYSTDKESGKTVFYEPGTRNFSEKLQDNFKRKYEAFYGNVPENLPRISPKCVLPKHKKVTQYKGFMISGWMGEYTISGEKEYLDFWYNTGIGSKNAEGFGMFEVISNN